MYAWADDVNQKSAEHLESLRQAELGILYVGLESGSDVCNKGVSKTDMLKAFDTLDRLGIGYGLSSILGLGGHRLWREHAMEAADLYNRLPEVDPRHDVNPCDRLPCTRILQREGSMF